jgi:hypothetical protein
MAKVTNLKKPMPVSKAALMAFVEGDTGAANTAPKGKGASNAENAPTGQKAGLVPTGDVRLTANIQADLHLKLKIRAAQERTTVGELIEQWIGGW